MKKKILIFGKNSFIGSNLYTFLKNKHIVKIISFNSKSLINLNKFDYVINCSINKNYINKPYSENYDFDFKIINKLNKNTNFIFLVPEKFTNQKLIFMKDQKLGV